jgi:hypothetical protein
MSEEVPTLTAFSAWTWRVTNYSTLPDPNQPKPARALSWVRCSVEGRPDAMVRLTSESATPEQRAFAAKAGSRPDFGPYFCELGPLEAGWYVLEVEGIDASVSLWLDGTASATVVYVPITTSTERLPHVLLLGQIMALQENFLALTRYVAKFGAVVTFDSQEAALAEHAILVGSVQLISEAVEQRLLEAGVRVERAQGDIAAQLDRAIQAGTPFLNP